MTSIPIEDQGAEPEKTCQICGKPSEQPECDACAEDEYRRWAG